jgi:hypothetical protein
MNLKILLYSILAAAVVLLGIIFPIAHAVKSTISKENEIRFNEWNNLWKNKSDTIYLNKQTEIDTIKEKKKTIPKVVTVYQKDTILRETIVTDTVVVFVEKGLRFLNVEKISPKGIVEVNHYPLPLLSTFEIDHDGTVQIKRYRLLKWITAAAFIAISSKIVINRVKRK